ncbi:MAG TPA: hypothetical protein PLI09_25295 [Candidatus Hydrogenedentes bacterium]|nr:hypothetical protein [Candidatus Hydrogenedentota bacterium]
MKYAVHFIVLTILIIPLACSKLPPDGKDDHVTTRGTIEVTAQLMEIPGEFPPNNLYDYAYVLKYKVLQVHRGKLDSDTILVGHYNPLKPRAKVKDKRVDDVGGTLRRFQAGDTHRMALESSIDEFYMGGIINEYAEKETGPVFWAVWTNPVAKK